MVEGAFSKIWVWRDIFLVLGLFQEFWLRGFYFVGGPFPKNLLSENFLVGGLFQDIGLSRLFLVECCFWLGGFFKNYGLLLLSDSPVPATAYLRQIGVA